jgi:N,N'-diacetyllegionaminate synthase
MERSLQNGNPISKKNIAIKRPGYGIQPKFFNQVLGKRANKDLDKEDVLMWGDIS